MKDVETSTYNEFAETIVTTNEGIVAQSPVRFTTMDYTTFSFLPGNRRISRKKVKKLTESIKMSNLTELYPILVNKDMQILDGQHRYVSCCELSLPIHYVIVGNIDISMIARLNNAQDKWTAYDFLNAWCEVGLQDYKIFAGFIRKYDFSFSVGQVLFFGKWGGRNYEDFREGLMKITTLKEATERAEWIHSLKEMSPCTTDRTFVLAMVQCFKNKDYDHSRMTKKLGYLGSSIKRSTNKQQYLRQLEEIYNYRTADTDKIRFW